eukprot:1159298-Pelagomonas_calceolata.AAC.1
MQSVGSLWEQVDAEREQEGVEADEEDALLAWSFHELEVRPCVDPVTQQDQACHAAYVPVCKSGCLGVQQVRVQGSGPQEKRRQHQPK